MHHADVIINLQITPYVYTVVCLLKNRITNSIIFYFPTRPAD
jgi:hypothetical protein